MWGDNLSLSGITVGNSFAQGESGGMPTFDYGGKAGTSVAVAQNAFTACRNAGGSLSDCGVKAYVSGQNPGSDIQIKSTQEIDTSWTDRAKLYGYGLLGVSTGNYGTAANSFNAAVGNKWGDLSVSRIAAGLVGIILIAASLYLLGTGALPNAIIGAAVDIGQRNAKAATAGHIIKRTFSKSKDLA